MSNPLDALSQDIARIASKAHPSVVAIHGRRVAPSSGIIWNGEGMVITAAHTLEFDDSFELTEAGGARKNAALVGRDPGTNVAVLRATDLDKPAPDWTETSRLEAGHLAVVVAPRRAGLVAVNVVDEEWTTRGGGRLDRYIEIDPKRFRGFSGSLLLDCNGQALGMNTTGLARRKPLTVPTETLRRVVVNLIEHGEVRRGFLGITTSPVRLPSTVESQAVGLLILSVQPESPAAAAGLFLGDVVLGIESEIAESPIALLTYLTEERIGQNVDMRILRAGEEKTVSVLLGKRT